VIDVMRILSTGDTNIMAIDFYCPNETWPRYCRCASLVWFLFKQLCVYCSVATPAQVARCDVSKVKTPWEHTRLLFEVNSLRGYLCKLA
jgi:hypothetical protein